MKRPRMISAAVALGLAGMLTLVSAAGETTLTVLCSNGLKAVIEELAPKFERDSRNKVVVKYGLAATLKQQIEAGEPFDVAFVTPGAMDDLTKAGKIAAGTRATVARVGLAIAIKTGARKPDIKTVDAFKRALLDAKGLAYAREGASGVAFAAIIQRLGIADQLKAKSKLTATGEEVADAVVKGESEFGILPVSEIVPIKGAEMLGTFPADVQSYIVMVGGASASSKQSAVARDFLAYVMAPAALPTVKKFGMER
jgi:molybdate transport system substrate-binding protein